VSPASFFDGDAVEIGHPVQGGGKGGCSGGAQCPGIPRFGRQGVSCAGEEALRLVLWCGAVGAEEVGLSLEAARDIAEADRPDQYDCDETENLQRGITDLPDRVGAAA